MTKQDVHETIKAKAAEYGFIAEESNWGINGLVIREDGESTVNFLITEHCDGDWENRKVNITLQVRASIATMGGNPSADELLKAADTIRRAAQLVKALDDENLTYQETF